MMSKKTGVLLCICSIVLISLGVDILLTSRERKVISRDCPVRRESVEDEQELFDFSLKLAEKRLKSPEKLQVIAFSVYSVPGQEERFVRRFGGGIVANVELARQIYPGWKVRIWASDTVPEPLLDKLSSYSHVEMTVVRWNETIKNSCTNFYSASGPAGWRFRVSDQKDVERFIVRDADSRLNWRERHAVAEWIRSGLPVHNMRDHPLGHRAAMQAGMWGATGQFLARLSHGRITMAKLLESLPGCGEADQRFLQFKVWPLVENFTLTHDSSADIREWCTPPKPGRIPCRPFPSEGNRIRLD